MRGLLVKDFYMIRSVVILMVGMFLVIGAGLTYLVSPQVLLILATVMMGMIEAMTINMDKACGWTHLSAALPVSREKMVHSKYVMYLILSACGLIVGMLCSLAALVVTETFDHDKFILFLCISITMALMAGSLILPCYFLLSEEKSVIGSMLVYPLSVAMIVGVTSVIGQRILALMVSVGIGAMVFILSWIVAGRVIGAKEL